MWNNQFFDNSGKPLSGGRIFTCSAGGSCPGTPLATFTDQSLFTANANPILLSTAGRPTAGANVVGIWLTTGLSYKFVVQNSAGSTIFTVDNVSGVTSSGGSGSGNYWTLTGSTINNNNGAGSGDVGVGGNLSVGTNLSVGQSIKMQTAGSQFAILRAPTAMAADVTWRWANADAAGPLCSDGLGNLSFGTCGGGGGGGGTPVGPTSSVQFNGGGGSFGGSANFTYNSGSQLVTINALNSGVAGLAVNTGFIQSEIGFTAGSSATAYNAFSAPNGGIGALSGSFVSYVQVGNSSGIPTGTGGDTFHAGALYWDTGTVCGGLPGLQVFNGSTWGCVTSGGSGSPGLPFNGVQFNSAGTFGSSANFTWDNTGRLLKVNALSSGVAGIAVGTGFIQSDNGFLATTATATAFNVIQAPGGGMQALNFSASRYIQSGNNTSGTDKPTVVAGDTFRYGALYFNVGLGAEQVCAAAVCSGGAGGTGWVSLGAGSGGSPAGANLSVQYNNGGAFGGAYNGTTGMWWDDGAKKLTITTPGATTALAVAPGYIQADGGFQTAGSNANIIQAPNGGVSGKWLIASDSLFFLEENAPALSVANQARMYADLSTHTLKLSQNGGAYVTIGGSGGGGVSSLNSLTGGLNIACAATSSCSIGASGTTVTITAPQPLATTSSPTFGQVTSTAAFVSSVTGGTIGLNINTNIQANGQGDLSITGNLSLNGTSGKQLNSLNTDATSFQTRGGMNVCSAGTCTSGNAFQINGTQVMTDTGFWIGHVNTPISGANIFYTGSGNFYTRAVAGLSTSISCSGVPDGWFAVATTDNFFVTCIGNARYRAALTFF